MTTEHKHKWVRLFHEPPYLGCLDCRQRNTLVKPTPQQAYDLLVSMGVPATEATRRTGYISKYRSGPRRTQKGKEAAKTGTSGRGDKQEVAQ